MGTNQLHLYSSPCRLCLNDDEFQLPIFEENARRKKILLKIQSCLPILKVKEDDPFPKTICYKCLSTLDTLYEFWQKCCSSETILRSRFTQNTYELVPYQKAGYNIEDLGGIDYPPYAHYRMRFPRSVSQSTHISFADSDSEDDWPLFNPSKKRSKMCIPKAKRNVKPSNDTRILKQETSYNIESVQPAIESIRNRRLSNWNKNTSENYRMDASISLLEMLEGDSYHADEYHEAHDVEQKSSFQSQHNPNEITAISNIPDKDFAANFCKLSTDENHMDTEQNNSDCKDDKQVVMSPRSKMPLHRNFMKKFSTEQSSSPNYISTSNAIYCQTSSESNLLPNSLVIPNGWLPESFRNQQIINTSYDNTTEEIKRNCINKGNKDDEKEADFWKFKTDKNDKITDQNYQKSEDAKLMLPPLARTGCKNFKVLPGKQIHHQYIRPSDTMTIQTSPTSKIIHNNLVIPNDWLPDTRNDGIINSNFENSSTEVKKHTVKLENKPLCQESTISSERSIQEHQQIQAHGKISDGSDLSYLLMNISKSHEGEAFARTRNLLSRFKTHLNDPKK